MTTTTLFFSFIFEIVAQFLNLVELLIFPVGEGRIYLLLKPKLSHTGACMSTNAQHVTLKSPIMSDNDNKQSNHRLINVL